MLLAELLLESLLDHFDLMEVAFVTMGNPPKDGLIQLIYCNSLDVASMPLLFRPYGTTSTLIYKSCSTHTTCLKFVRAEHADLCVVEVKPETKHVPHRLLHLRTVEDRLGPGAQFNRDILARVLPWKITLSLA